MAERSIKPNDDKFLATDAAHDLANEEAIPAGSYDELWQILRDQKARTMSSSKPQPLMSTSESSKKKGSPKFDQLFLKPRMIQRLTEKSRHISLALRNEIHQTLANIIGNIPADTDEHQSIEKLSQSSEPSIEEAMTLFKKLLEAENISPSSFEHVCNLFTARFILKSEEDLMDVFRDTMSWFNQLKLNEAHWESFWDILPGNRRKCDRIDMSDPRALEKQGKHCFVSRRFKCPIRDKRKGTQVNILGPPPLYECVKDLRSSNVGETVCINPPNLGHIVSMPFNDKIVPVENRDARDHDWLVDAVFNFFLRAAGHIQQPYLRLAQVAGGCPLISYEFKDDNDDKRAEGERYLAFVNAIFLWEIIQLTALGENLVEMSKGGLPQEGIPIRDHSHFHLYSVLVCGPHFHFYKTRIATRLEAQKKYSQGRYDSLPVSFTLERLTSVRVENLKDLEQVFQFLAVITVDAYHHLRLKFIKYGSLFRDDSPWQEKNAWINDFDVALTYRTTQEDDDTPYMLVPITNFKVIFVQEDDSDEL